MTEYPKIQGVFKRDEKTHKFIEGAWSLPEFEYLRWNDWVWTEKVDGMNIRVSRDSEGIVQYRGKTDKAQLPADLLERLAIVPSKFGEVFDSGVDICLYGEGFGAGIQKGGNYSPTKKFVLFDIKIGHWWLKRGDVRRMARELEIDMVPIVVITSLRGAIYRIKQRNIKSVWGDFLVEGIVGTPIVPLHCRNGGRVITKLKHKDFE